MKKNLLYLLLILILGGITYYFVFKEEDNAFGKEEANFNVKSIADIKTIFLSNLKNENIKLSKVKDNWTLNDTLEVRMDAVKFLLEALEHQRAVQPVSLLQHDDVIRDISVNNTKVEIYNQDNKRTNTFYVCLNPGINNSTYMLTEGAKRPYIVKLPLQNMYLGVRYFTTVGEWQSKHIMYHASPIESIQIDYKDSVQYSFALTIKDSNVSIQGPYLMQKPINKKRINSYLGFWEKLFCTGYEDRNMLRAGIIDSGRQMATIQMKRKDCPLQTLMVYFRPQDQGTKATLHIGNQYYDFDSFFGLLNNKNFVLLSRHTVEHMVRTYPEFYEIGEEVPNNNRPN